MPPNIPGKKSLSVILPEEFYKAVKAWAEQKEWSLSKAARRLMEIGFDTEVGSDKQPAKKSRVKK
jgi:hypothetical protein